MGGTLRKPGGDFKAEMTMRDQNATKPQLLVFGPGFSARPVIERALKEGWRVSATWRRPEAKAELEALGVEPIEFVDAALAAADLGTVSHILVSVAPGADGDPAFALLQHALDRMPSLKWIGYLSSTNVYGDHAGAWVDETSETKPSLARGIRRLEAEQAWTALGEDIDAAVHIFRLAGIYGPGRNAIRSVLDGKARRIIKEGQVFGRIHRDDIAEAVRRAMLSSLPSHIFNLADDLPAPPQDVVEEAARLLGTAPPPAVALEEADMSPMARSFYAESKRVSNQKAKELLGWQPAYPDYHTALPKLLESERARAT